MFYIILIEYKLIKYNELYFNDFFKDVFYDILCIIFEEDFIDLLYGLFYKYGIKLLRNKFKQICKLCWDSIWVRIKNYG